LPGVAAPAAVADSIAPELGRFVFGDQPSGSPRRGAAAIGARPVSAKVPGASVAGGEGDAAPSSSRAPIQLDTADVSGGETGPARAAQALPGLPSETAGGEQPTTAPRPSPLSVTGAAPSAVALSDPSLAPSAPRQPIGVNVESPAWGAALGARMVWNVSNGVQSASLDLNPRDLGPVNVLLHVSDDEVSLAFNSQHAVVREAIEAALPRLRDMLASSGFELAGVEIGADPRERGAGERASSGDRDLASGDAGDGSGPASEAELNVRLTDALVDTFA
jgi:flagellar hook-length control protein FliK